MKGTPSPAGLPASPGTYLLVLRIDAALVTDVGRLGRVELPPGVALYAGSARGPGGLAARIGHHLSPCARPHWHLDHLRVAGARVEGVCYGLGEEREECDWALAMCALPGRRVAVPRFGASDCRCATHLLGFAKMPAWREITRRLPRNRNVLIARLQGSGADEGVGRGSRALGAFVP